MYWFRSWLCTLCIFYDSLHISHRLCDVDRQQRESLADASAGKEDVRSLYQQLVEVDNMRQGYYKDAVAEAERPSAASEGVVRERQTLHISTQSN